MNIICDAEGLSRLISNLSALSGVRAVVLDRDGREICASGPRAALCECLSASPEGRARCRGCALRRAEPPAGGISSFDLFSSETSANRGREEDRAPAAVLLGMRPNGPDGDGVRFARCHAGALLAGLPIRLGARRETVAWLAAGGVLPDGPIESQWARAREALGWFPGDPAALRDAFRASPRRSREALDALAGMMALLADYIPLRELIQPAAESDAQRLKRFLDAHYMEKLSLASISAQLRIGRTRLCALAKELSGGQTLFTMITRRRISAAKALLVQTDRPISAIAEAVGISDYNYFSKIFRSAAGISPSEFRKRARNNLDNLV